MMTQVAFWEARLNPGYVAHPSYCRHLGNEPAVGSMLTLYPPCPTFKMNKYVSNKELQGESRRSSSERCL